MTTIRNPVEWCLDQVRLTALGLGAVGRALDGSDAGTSTAPLTVSRITIADLRDVLVKGFADFAAYRTDVIFLCIIYPAVGIILARLAFNHDLLPLLFPLGSGFALIGPFAAIGLYEMSRRREHALHVTWPDAFGVIRAPTFGRIVALGLLLMALLVVWLATAQMIYELTLGPEPPTSFTSFIRDMFTTGAGWTMIGVGVGVGFLFAALVLTISVVSFPLLLDRDVSLGVAMRTSIRAVAVNPFAMAIWGLIVAAGLVIGSIPVFIGLVVVMPVLGHATWHLYRKMVPG